MSAPTVVINHNHLRHNLELLAGVVSPSQVMLAVKTNAYGHGLEDVCATAVASGVQQFAVLEISAGVALRQQGISVPLFAWLFADDEISHALANDIDLGISRIEQLRVAANMASTSSPARVHLKIDTGLTRNGALPSQWRALCAEAMQLESAGVIDVVGIWTHLADATPVDDEAALRTFNEAVSEAREIGLTPQLLHVGASSAGLRFPPGRQGAVRFGIAAYGVSPFDSPSSSDLGLKPVMTVMGRVTHIADSHAIVSGGFGHGVPIGVHPERFVSIDGHPYRVVTVDVDEMHVAPFENEPARWPLTVGDIAVIFGEGGPSAEMLGGWCNTIGDEVVTGIPSRLPRQHLHQ
jgi:alanine racemase